MVPQSNNPNKQTPQRSWQQKYVNLTVLEANDKETRDNRMRQNGMDPAKKMLIRTHRTGVTIVQYVENKRDASTRELVGLPQ